MKSALEVLELVRGFYASSINEEGIKSCYSGLCSVVGRLRIDNVLSDKEVRLFKDHYREVRRDQVIFFAPNGVCTTDRSQFGWPIYTAKPRLMWLDAQIEELKNKQDVIK